jgi:hypothetical protein
MSVYAISGSTESGEIWKNDVLIYFNFQRKTLFCDENVDPKLDTLLEEGSAAFVLRRGNNDNLVKRWDPGSSFTFHGDKMKKVISKNETKLVRKGGLIWINP